MPFRQCKKNEKGQLELNLTTKIIDEEDLASFPSLKPGKYVKLSVSDTGQGMTTEVQQRIFDPFFTTKERGEGTGLGMSVVHGILKSHNSMITVDSEPGQGSTFTVYMPVLDKVHLKQSKRKGHLPSGSEKILLVDDEIKLIEASKEMLNKLGYKVFEHTNPHDCLAMIKKAPMSFDLVISDLTMPEMTGTELIREIFKIRPDMPVIILTGYVNETQQDEIETLGINKVIHKPVTMSKMASAIREALGKK